MPGMGNLSTSDRSNRVWCFRLCRNIRPCRRIHRLRFIRRCRATHQFRGTLRPMRFRIRLAKLLTVRFLWRPVCEWKMNATSRPTRYLLSSPSGIHICVLMNAMSELLTCRSVCLHVLHAQSGSHPATLDSQWTSVSIRWTLNRSTG